LEKKLADKKRRLIAENGKRPKINNNKNGKKWLPSSIKKLI
jgi:hypothetical protein